MANPVPSTALADFQFNVGALDKAINEAGRYVDRFGIARKTLAQILADAQVDVNNFLLTEGFLPPVAFASGLNVTTSAFTVEYSGNWYRAKIGSVPFTTTGTFNAAQWEYLSGVSKSELISTAGAALVGHGVQISSMGNQVSEALLDIGGQLPGGVSVISHMTLAEQADALTSTPTLNHTSSIMLANVAGKRLIFPAGYTFNLMNWEPAAGTIICANGATIQRFASTTFGATGSSGAVIITNDNVEVRGGKWRDKPGITTDVWSGAFIINGGDNFLLHDGYEITGTWGAVNGHLAQNGSLVSKNLRVMNGWMHHNVHNTYFADVDGLVFMGNISEYSDRDGFKAYRNINNPIVVGNHFRFNGIGTVGQSQDGMDMFIGGERCIIANNFMHNNTSKGLDIKRTPDGSSETYQDRNYIVANNFIFSNGDIGIQTEEGSVTVGGVTTYGGKMTDMTFVGNHIFNNAGRGAYLGSLQNSKFIGNHMYGNGSDGLRVDTADALLISGNVSYGNTTGYNIVSGTGITLTGNIARGGGTQVNGILWAEAASGRCYDNDSSGHTTDILASGTAPLVRGKVLDSKITNTTNSQFVAVGRKGCISQMELTVNNTATMDVSLSKRNATTGANDGTITTAAAKSFPTTFVTVSIGISGSNSLRQQAGNNALLLTLANITSSFTDGVCRIHYID